MSADDQFMVRTPLIMEKYKTTFERLSPDKERIPIIKKKLVLC